MNLSIDELENRLQVLIENHLGAQLAGRRAEDRLSQQLAAAIKSNLSTQELKKYAPGVYTIVAHAAQIDKWQNDSRFTDDLLKIIKTVGAEAGIFFRTGPTILFATNAYIANDDIQVMVSNQVEAVGETQNVIAEHTPEEESIPRNAFLIIGGVKVHPLTQAVVNIGRRLDNHIVIDDPRVSRYHCQIRAINKRFVVFDLNSTGGTFVNGQRANQSVLYPGDVISLAGLPVIFGQDNPPANARVGSTAPLSISSSERSTAILKKNTGKFRIDKQ
jgi:hypothetical protein